MFTPVMTKFLDVALTKMKKKLLYKKFVSVQVLFESRLYERSLAIFFSTFLEHASLVESESVSSQEESPREFSPEG